jgi:NhaA family Na+:H+ antiporter
MTTSHDTRSPGLAALARHDAAPGVLLLAAAALAMVVANSPLAGLYGNLLDTRVTVAVGTAAVSKPLVLWINDGLMAVFFLLVGLELKREFLAGELSDPRRLVLPGFAAVGGMLLPALIYAWINHDDPEALRGWAIPAATDIAFAVGVLALLGSRVPTILKVFLLSIAILDDLGAIVIIALFYTDTLSAGALLAALGAVVVLALLARARVRAAAPYVIVGIVLWLAVLESGVHATLAGVVLALFVPAGRGEALQGSLLVRMEHGLHPWVAFGVLPLFAFANAGVALPGLNAQALLSPVPLGIAAGLVVGKQLGVFGFAWLAVALHLARPLPGVGWGAVYGVAALCGIGFTMSLFISSLAFEQGAGGFPVDDRLGILVGSLISATIGFLVLRRALAPGDAPQARRVGAASHASA